MSESQHVDRVVGRVVSIERHVAGISERYQQLAQFWMLRQGPADVRCRFQDQELPLYGLTGPFGGFRSFSGQKPPATHQPQSRAFRDDYSWQSGIAFSSSAPQVDSQVLTSWPVKCRPVS